MFPIVQREIAVAARRGALYRSRYIAGAAAGAGALGALFWADRVWQFSTTPGEFLFLFTAVVAALFCYGAGLFLTVDCISSEKRQGTLGLLFLTELRGADIVLGKLAAAGATAVSGFLTIFPIMAISIALGGVTGTQLWHMTIALCILLLVSLSAGIFISVLFEREGPGILLFGTLMLLPSVVTACELASGKLVVSLWALKWNPLYLIYAAADLQAGAAPPPLIATLLSIPKQYFWSSAARSLLLAVVFLVAASVILPLTITSSRSHLFSGLFRSKTKTNAKQSTGPTSVMHRHPVVWLSVRDKSAVLALWILFTAGALSVFWDPFGAFGIAAEGLFYPLFLHYVLKLFVAYEASRMISQEKEGGLMELLLTTPVNAGVILASKKTALRRHFLGPLIYALCFHLFYIVTAMRLDPLAGGPWLAFASMAVLFMDFFSLSWIGMWQGLTTKSLHRAFLRTVLGGMALPWLPFFLFMTLVWFLFGSSFSLEVPVFLTWGFISAAVVGVGTGLYALARVHYGLRHKIAEG